MESFSRFPRQICRNIRFVLTDIDDTLTRDERLAARTYDALKRLHQAGLKIVPVTAAPAGWCDQIARMWPVDGIIGENGGFSFVHDHGLRRMRRRYWLPEHELDANRERLARLAASVMQEFPKASLAREHAYREITVGIEFETLAGHRRDGPSIVERLAKEGANATLNSFWVIGWLGDFNKLAMAHKMMAETFALDLSMERERVLYVGDSINDEPIFGFFPHAVGVSTARSFLPQMASPPRWITDGPGGDGFVEVADMPLRHR